VREREREGERKRERKRDRKRETERKKREKMRGREGETKRDRKREKKRERERERRRERGKVGVYASCLFTGGFLPPKPPSTPFSLYLLSLVSCSLSRPCSQIRAWALTFSLIQSQI